MGINAQQLFAQNSIEVFMGVNSDSPSVLVENYFNNQLVTGENLCDSDQHGHEHSHHNNHRNN
jgi:hypothetical protein